MGVGKEERGKQGKRKKKERVTLAGLISTTYSASDTGKRERETEMASGRERKEKGEERNGKDIPRVEMSFFVYRSTVMPRKPLYSWSSSSTLAWLLL